MKVVLIIKDLIINFAIDNTSSDMKISSSDIRWIQRFSNYRRAFAKLSEAIDSLSNIENLDEPIRELIKEGVIQRFEYTHELAWKVIKDYAEYQGYTDIHGSRDAFRKGLQMGIIDSPDWMDSIEDRNLTSHNYDEDIAQEIYDDIINKYYPLFVKLADTMTSLANE